MAQSTDSRTHGPVERGDILGRVVAKLPRAVKPPTPRGRFAIGLSYGLAAVMLVFALVHLFRIDTLIPLLALALDLSVEWTSLLVAVIVIGEVLALPYLLMMRLSPLMHVVSGKWALLIPLWWLGLSIWVMGLGFSTGQLGAFVFVEAHWWVVLLNALWLGLSFGLLWLRRYDVSLQALRKGR